MTVVGGANGSGKSTLLRIVAGAAWPTAGRVRGRPEVVGYVPDRFPRQVRLSPESYLVHMGRIHGLGTAAAVRRSRELLDRLEVKGDWTRPMNQLSKGNAQKVALAQAVVAGPRLLVLDEPWTGLDDRAQSHMAQLVVEARGAGAMVIVSHAGPPTAARIAGDANYELIDGCLVAANEPPPAPAPEGLLSMTMVELRACPGTWERGLPVPAVISELADRVTPGDDGLITVAVAAPVTDELLRAALAAGWSVYRVERH